MKPMNRIALTLLCLSLWPGFAPSAMAADAVKYGTNCDRSDVLINEDGSKPVQWQYDLKARLEKECRQKKAETHKKAITARATLKSDFHVDASQMSDDEAVYRLQKEQADAKQARQEASEQQEQEAAMRRDKQTGVIMERQKKMMQSMGLSLPADSDSDDDSASDDKMQEQMYRKMVEGGAAPQCKGKSGAALIKCVDAAMDADH